MKYYIFKMQYSLIEYKELKKFTIKPKSREHLVRLMWANGVGEIVSDYPVQDNIEGFWEVDEATLLLTKSASFKCNSDSAWYSLWDGIANALDEQCLDYYRFTEHGNVRRILSKSKGIKILEAYREKHRRAQ